ncbi:Pom152 protein [Saccharomycopsis crataegensis]|uniref:Pom152 protein n=1 Tax=Saccharomycopsis crataegensis TaxID=43959 RepID=A0AAV5QSQ9_9ASCO|nr:Pom152 protein [Saccharomycopsis crataegensis]
MASSKFVNRINKVPATQSSGSVGKTQAQKPIEPLIPSNIIDVASQKAYFIGIFLLIQAWKIQQCVILKTTENQYEYDQFAFILKFFVIDSLFLWLLPIFRIPSLTFHPFITFLQSIMITTFTIFLSCNLTTVFSPLIVSIYGVSKISKTPGSNSGLLANVHRDDIASDVEVLGNLEHSDSDYFKGKKTINILPKSTFHFNPFGENHCIDSEQNVPTLPSLVTVPIKFNSSNEISNIELIYTDYENNTKVINYNKRQIKSVMITDKHKFNALLRKDLIVNGRDYTNDKHADFESILPGIDLTRISFAQLTLDKPGFYRIGRVVDAKNMPVKVYSSNMIISKCPNARIFDVKDSKDIITNKDYKCIGDYNNLKININGVPPLRVKYTKMFNEHIEVVEEKLLQPASRDFKSPLVTAASVWDSKSSQFFSVSDFLRKLNSKELENFFSWSDSYESEVKINKIVKKPGDYSYILEEVEDGFGNVVNLTSIYELEYNTKYSSKYPSLEEYLKNEKLYQTSTAYESPKLKLIDTLPNKPLIEKESRDLKLVINGLDYNSHQNIKELQKLEPIYANITYINNNDNVLDSSNEKRRREILIENYEFNTANDFKFIAENPGSYKLESVDLKYCPGLIDDTSKRIDIFKAFKPYLSVLSSSSINDTCLGQIGLSFDLLLTGIPPFEVKVNNYQFIDNGKKKLIGSKKLKVQSSNRFQYNYEPEHEGNYEIEFSAVHDNIYKNFIDLQPIEKYRFKTSMRAKPDAMFLDLFNNKDRHGQHHGAFEKRLCLSSESEILPVKLNGEAPFEITYDITERATSRRKTYTAKSINSNNYNLKLPVFTKGGNYVVSLTSIKDKSNCVVLLNGQDININIKKELPFARFEPTLESEVVTLKGTKGYNIKIKDGQHVDLPIKLVGEKNVQLSYKVVDYDGKTIKDTLVKSFNNYQNKAVLNSNIRVSNAGVYYLTGVKDNLCLGKVDEGSFYNVTYYSKPELIINESKNSMVTKRSNNIFAKGDICLNEHHNVIDLLFKGEAPFVVDYNIELPNGARKQKSIKVSSNFISINLLGDLHPSERLTGIYTYTFTSISDAIYSKSDLRSLGSYMFEKQVIRQNVIPVPNAKFLYRDSSKVLQTCSNNLVLSSDFNSKNSKFLDPLVLKLEGHAPFEAHLEVYNENFNKFHSIVLQDINTSTVNLNKEILKYLSLGNHFITVKKVIDGKGCIKDEFPIQSKELNSISANNAGSVLLDHQVMISITDTPKISKVTAGSDLCIGEYVDYKLHGTGPFEIQYLFNDDIKTATVKNLFDFKRLLVQPGVLEIISVRDVFKCVVELDSAQRKDSRVIIHDKPSVEIVNPNDENIQEGDEVEISFKFTGVAPFNLIYKRIFNNLKDSEIYHVNNIESNEYRIKTSLQGSYIAIEVRDAHCEIRRNV